MIAKAGIRAVNGSAHCRSHASRMLDEISVPEQAWMIPWVNPRLASATAVAMKPDGYSSPF